MTDNMKPIAVYGATGHTGRFVVNELARRELPLVAVGRDLSRLAASLPAGLPARSASIDDPAALDRALEGCAVVINCAGPFLDTAAALVEAALRAGCHYIDVSAEQASAQEVFARYDQAAREAGVAVVPAAGFYGGLADLLASAVAAAGQASDITTAVALDHWWPTEGTRKTGERNRVARVIVKDGELAPMPLPAETRDWRFGGQFGVQPMAELSFSEVITISRHLPVRSLRSYLNTKSLEDVRDSATPSPTAIDAHGRSAQRFAMDVVAAGAGGVRRATATGQDIYAVTAPIVVEAAARMLAASFRQRGALALGQAFDARGFLAALAPYHLAVELDAP